MYKKNKKKKNQEGKLLGFYADLMAGLLLYLF